MLTLPANNPYGQFDYIFLGAGCASLSLLVRMIDSGRFNNKTFLLVDKKPKTTNDRTWCFWEKEQGYFENLVYKRWNNLSVISDQEYIDLDITPYTYKMIRGIDFYDHCFKKVTRQNNILVAYGSVEFVNDPKPVINFNGKALYTSASIVFNSIPTVPADTAYHQLLQHFKGWFIEAPGAFDIDKATLMDFSISQQNGTTFVYVLPFSASNALVEYTLFSPSLLKDEQYDKALTNYIHAHLNIKNFRITETEFGVIPMTDQPFHFYKNGRYNIGTAGGVTKPSTGYTFRFIQKQSNKILADIINTGTPLIQKPAKKFKFYDSTFLNVLATNKLEGKKVFTTLFKRNKASAIFKFLDNESFFLEDISIISSLPARQFLSAGLKEIFK